jgi:subtilisin family serine protease
MLPVSSALLALALVATPIAVLVGPAPLPDGRVPTDLVVGFDDALPPDVDALAASAGARIELRDDVLAWARFHFATEARADAAMATLLAVAGVRYVEHDTYAEALLTPDDSLWAQQWGPMAIHAPAAWDSTTGSHAIRLAILDTGVDFGHADVAPNLCGPFASFIPGQAVQDGFGHGTHVAGIAAGALGNGVGIAGVSQSCLMVGKVLGDADGRSQGTSVAAGIRWAADEGARIESLSLGRLDFLQATADAVAYAYARDVLIVASAGNNGCPQGGAAPVVVPPNGASPLAQNQGSIGYPAFHDEVMAVAALFSPGDQVDAYSSCGPDMEIAAPGSGVVAPLPACTGTVSLCSNTGYGALSGTSMAAPHVAGVGALVLAQHPSLHAEELRCILDLSAHDLSLPGRDHLTGWGRVDARAALDLDATLTAEGLHAAFAEACHDGALAIFA